jgi:hypothetical protein
MTLIDRIDEKFDGSFDLITTFGPGPHPISSSSLQRISWASSFYSLCTSCMLHHEGCLDQCWACKCKLMRNTSCNVV